MKDIEAGFVCRKEHGAIITRILLPSLFLPVIVGRDWRLIGTFFVCYPHSTGWVGYKEVNQSEYIDEDLTPLDEKLSKAQSIRFRFAET